jgi:hypothetical protein
MSKKLVSTWIIVSFLTVVGGWIWNNYDAANNTAFLLYFCGGISSLLAVGYYSTPSNSIYGKIAFGFIVLMVGGVSFKVLRYIGGNEMIVVSLLGIFATYMVMWFREERFF